LTHFAINDCRHGVTKEAEISYAFLEEMNRIEIWIFECGCEEFPSVINSDFGNCGTISKFELLNSMRKCNDPTIAFARGVVM
jgi:hypothetical protein